MPKKMGQKSRGDQSPDRNQPQRETSSSAPGVSTVPPRAQLTGRFQKESEESPPAVYLNSPIVSFCPICRPLPSVGGALSPPPGHPEVFPGHPLRALQFQGWEVDFDVEEVKELQNSPQEGTDDFEYLFRRRNPGPLTLPLFTLEVSLSAFFQSDS
eukprot:bmy_03085T0